jgi:ketosteroid isomerase-like protein
VAESAIDIVRGVYERWARGDFTNPPFDDHVTLVLREEFPEAGVYVGPDEVRKYTYGLLEPWERLALVPEEIVPVGDTVIVKVHQEAVGKGSGVPAEMRYFMVWTFRGEKAVHIESMMDEADARQAVGLDP